MKKLFIELNSSYRSFEKGFKASIEGDLVILTGVNGVGKSQLISIINKKDKINNVEIDSKITIDNLEIKKEHIDFRSFIENIGVSEIIQPTPQMFIQFANDAWNNFNSHLLDQNKSELRQYSDSCIEAKRLLLEHYSLDDFNSKKIPHEDFKKILKDADFIWKIGDLFSNKIGEIFFAHALKINEIMIEVGREKFQDNMLEEAPWITLNNLFEKLKFDYRFRTDFRLVGLELNYTPILYAVKADGSTDMENVRYLTTLSDGEKAIISLCFASLSNNSRNNKKILLLDEIDSVLNPSLIQLFFNLIHEYFIEKGRMVIICTHSPATISLSPDYAKIYEVFKPIHNTNRIVEISKNEYSELSIANKNFYEKIRDQEKRLSELTKNISSNQNILIVTEGKTDWKYFAAALKFFHKKDKYLSIKEEYFYKFGSQDDYEKQICGTNHVNELSDSKLFNYLSSLVSTREIDKNNSNTLRIGIFDSDTNTRLINVKDINVYSFKIEPNNISTELLFNDDEIKSLISERRLYLGEEFNPRTKIHKTDTNLTLGGDSSNTNKAGKRCIIETDVYNRSAENVCISKELFSQAVYNEIVKISDESWFRFSSILEKIEKIIIENEL